MTDRLSLETFSPAVGTAFIAETGAGAVSLLLAEVTTREQYVPDAPDGWRPFTLRFTGPAEPFLDQRTYRLTNDTTGPVDVFVVPVGRDADGLHYEAVFG
ncbi:MAG TPA: hypothetical protein VNA20_16455 [Frankiaceae bacterium]|nr:hypothetical protein [Frankiaceae bacterium]